MSIHLSPSLKAELRLQGGWACRQKRSKQVTDFVWWMADVSADGGEERSDEGAFHPNNIPQCFSIDGSRDRRRVNSFFISSMLVKRNSVMFLFCNYFIFLLMFLFLALNLHGGKMERFFCFLKESDVGIGALSLFLTTSARA